MIDLDLIDDSTDQLQNNNELVREIVSIVNQTFELNHSFNLKDLEDIL